MNAGCAGKTEISWKRVPYLSALEVCSRRGAIQIHVYLCLAQFEYRGYSTKPSHTATSSKPLPLTFVETPLQAYRRHNTSSCDDKLMSIFTKSVYFLRSPRVGPVSPQHVTPPRKHCGEICYRSVALRGIPLTTSKRWRQISRDEKMYCDIYKETSAGGWY